MCAAAVDVAGPIGFIGLAAPAAVRLLAKAVPAVSRHTVLLPLSGLVGALVVLLADALMRQALGAGAALRVPTGVTTTILGAVVLVLLARRFARRRAHPAAAGERAPRVVAALAGGAALALAGTVVQAVCRNPLAEPGILGITGGAGLGAVVVTVAAAGGTVSTGSVSLGASAGALAAFVLVYGLSWRGGLGSDRLVLVGIGVAAGTAAVTALLIVNDNPWDTPTIYTFLSGSTYNRTWEQVVPLLVVLAAALPVAWTAHRDLDLFALDDDTPRLAGVRLERTRLVVLVLAALLTAAAVSAVGVVGFVGLVAPHVARALVGGRHLRVVPVALLLGAVLLVVADTLGRWVIAPSQLPAGLLVAVIGAPHFLYLLHRSRA